GHLAFRPDGRVLVWLGEGRMHRRDVLTGDDLPVPAEPDLTVFGFSRAGLWLAPAHTSGLIRIGDEATGQEVLRFRATPASIGKLIWATDGRTLFSENGDTTVLIWDLTPPGW